MGLMYMQLKLIRDVGESWVKHLIILLESMCRSVFPVYCSNSIKLRNKLIFAISEGHFYDFYYWFSLPTVTWILSISWMHAVHPWKLNFCKQQLNRIWIHKRCSVLWSRSKTNCGRSNRTLFFNSELWSNLSRFQERNLVVTSAPCNESRAKCGRPHKLFNASIISETYSHLYISVKFKKEEMMQQIV